MANIPAVHPTNCVNDYLYSLSDSSEDKTWHPMPDCFVQWLDKVDRENCLLDGKGTACQ